MPSVLIATSFFKTSRSGGNPEEISLGFILMCARISTSVWAGFKF